MSGCQAAVPLLPLEQAHPALDARVAAWVICSRPATANYTYLCAAGRHLVNRSNCPEHEPRPGMTGCKGCWTEFGEEIDMEVQP